MTAYLGFGFYFNCIARPVKQLCFSDRAIELIEL